MNTTIKIVFGCMILGLGTGASASTKGEDTKGVELRAGHESLQEWLLPHVPPVPENNQMTPERIELGKKLFFDPRLSGDKNISCATCHNPSLGWSDGLATGIGHRGTVLERATPTIVNTAFNSIQMWDGREPDLEGQATGPMAASVEMHSDFDEVFAFLNNVEGYREAFAKAYPGEDINKTTLAKAIATYERTIVSNNSPFDQWIKGDESAMNEDQINGFRVFLDGEKGNCAACHSGPNFTDNGFHNLGLENPEEETADKGRFGIKPIRILKGAFKTPTLRDVALTAPYFHNGEAKTLEDVVQHYIDGMEGKTYVSPNMKPLKLTEKEKSDLVEFMKALTSEQQIVSVPVLPQ